MRSPRSIPIVLALGLTACGNPPPLPEPKPRPKAIKVDRRVLGAFRDYLYAGYDLLLAKERPQQVDVEALKTHQAQARNDLRRALRRAGASAGQVETPEAMVKLVREGIVGGHRYALVTAPGDETVSVVRIRARREPRRIKLFGEPFAYLRTIHDEVIVLDYTAYRALRLKRPVPRQTATYRAAGRKSVVRIDRAAARQVGEQLFLPRVAALRASAAKAGDVQAFLRQKDQLPALLALTKDALRWRSLEPLWSLIGSLPQEEQLRRFTEDYTSRAELRAATELREAKAFGKPLAELTAAERVGLFERGSLAAAIHGDPLGQLADVLALAVVSLRSKAQAPHFLAARRLVVDVVGRLRQGPPSNEADARALARLAKASRDELREVVTALYRSKQGG